MKVSVISDKSTRGFKTPEGKLRSAGAESDLLLYLKCIELGSIPVLLF